ncbi:MAG TPA: DUF1385 domain-containing protein [Acidimicrobiales bacterium]|nr:DUF1385 domain-containing protein [Acidimicrobiales bacterium]
MASKAGAIRPGGQALADGVLMRTKLAWAIARADGTVETGAIARTPMGHVPGLRVLAGLAGGLRLGVGRGFFRGRAHGGNRRFLFILAATELVALGLLFGLGPMADGLPAPLSALLSLSSGAIALTIVRKAAPGSLWRYHGAEHKAAAAFEAGAPANDVDAALAMTRLHPRCGTNLLVPLAAVGIALSGLSSAAQLIGGAAALAFTAEALTLAARRRTALWSRLLLAPGLFLQRYVTTAEPTREEQAVACHAMVACLEEHARQMEPAFAPVLPLVTAAAA